MSWFSRFFGSAQATGDYRCSSSIKQTMLGKYPDLKASQMEALNYLATQKLSEATEKILGLMADSAVVDLIDKLRAIDSTAAKYLDQARSAAAQPSE